MDSLRIRREEACYGGAFIAVVTLVTLPFALLSPATLTVGIGGSGVPFELLWILFFVGVARTFPPHLGKWRRAEGRFVVQKEDESKSLSPLFMAFMLLSSLLQGIALGYLRRLPPELFGWTYATTIREGVVCGLVVMLLLVVWPKHAPETLHLPTASQDATESLAKPQQAPN